MGMKPRRALAAHDVWEALAGGTFSSEATVETRLVLGLLCELGYSKEHIESNFTVKLSTGRGSRNFFADFAIFGRTPHDKASSLLVVETKSPAEGLDGAAEQAESYANGLKAPLYVVTDGITLEVWQIQRAGESVCVLKLAVSSLAARRDDIERILHRDAVVDYCKSVEIKNIQIESFDYGAYSDSVLGTFLMSDWVPLSRELMSRGRAIESRELLSGFERGCVIRAASGSGKSYLLRQLATQLLERLETKHVRIPVYVDLADVSELPGSLKEQLHARIRHYVPALAGEGAFESYWRGGHLTILCDSWDFVAPGRRAKVGAELRTILRETQAQVILVTRADTGTFEDVLSHLELRPLNSNGQVQLAGKHGLDAQTVGRALSRLPRSIRSHTGNPLFLDRILEHIGEGFAPASITSVFEWWIDRILRRDHPSGGQVSSRKELLRELSLLGAHPSLEAVNKRTSELHAADEYKGLVKLGVIIEVASGLRFAHDSIGQFLRASHASSLSDAGERAVSEIVSAGHGSLVGIFLAGMIGDMEQQSALWNRLVETDLRAYLDGLTVRMDVSAEIYEMSDDAQASWFLEQLLRGHDQLIRRWFHTCAYVFHPYRRARAVDLGSATAAIRGRVSRSPSVSYQYLLSGPATPVVDVATTDWRDGPSHGRYLFRTDARIDSPRLQGAKDVRSELEAGVKELALDGGVVWARERLLCRFRSSGSDLDLSIDQVREILADDTSPEVEEIKRDIELVDVPGITQIGALHLPPGDLESGYGGNWTEAYSESLLLNVFHEQLCRIMSSYREVVETSLKEVKHLLFHYPQWPIRYDVVLVRSAGTRGNTVWAEHRWEPVLSWDKSEVRVRWSNASRPSSTDEDVEVLRAKLRRFDRPSERLMIDMSSLLRRDYSSTETYVAHAVSQMLKEDIDHLFDVVR